jgi:hypothetical protein
MRKRKREGSEPKLLSRKPVPAPMLPPSLWTHVLIFLEQKDFSHVVKANRILGYNVLKFIIDVCQQKAFFPFAIKNFLKLSQHLMKQCFFSHPRYYTLLDFNYIQLFKAVEALDFDAAKAFIESKRKYLSLVDMVFYQKDGHGETVITLARRLNFQIFLDYCFQTLIFNNFGRKCGIVKPGNYQQILLELESDRSDTALWLFACAFVCNQTMHCQAILQTKAWKKPWMDTDEDHDSLFSIAAMLGCVDLLDFALKILTSDELRIQSSLVMRYDSLALYHNPKPCGLSMCDLIALSKNQQLITRYSESDFFGCGIELIFYYMEKKDLEGLQNFFDENSIDDSLLERSLFPNSYYGIHSQHRLIPIGVAVAKNWVEGVQCMIDNGFSILSEPRPTIIDSYFTHFLSIAIDFGYVEMALYLLSQGIGPDGFTNPAIEEPAPIFYAVKNNSLELVEILLNHGASLEITNKADDLHRFPLVSAILYGHEHLTQYMINRLGIHKAMEQINEVGKVYNLSSLEAAYSSLIGTYCSPTNVYRLSSQLSQRHTPTIPAIGKGFG